MREPYEMVFNGREQVWTPPPRNYTNEHGDTLSLSDAPRDPIDYSNEAVWTFRRRGTEVRHIIYGPAAQILRRYPKDYVLYGPHCFIDWELDCG